MSGNSAKIITRAEDTGLETQKWAGRPDDTPDLFISHSKRFSRPIIPHCQPSLISQHIRLITLKLFLALTLAR
jgi:hypothetical protein